jgi:hypothetical protein
MTVYNTSNPVLGKSYIQQMWKVHLVNQGILIGVRYSRCSPTLLPFCMYNENGKRIFACQLAVNSSMHTCRIQFYLGEQDTYYSLYDNIRTYRLMAYTENSDSQSHWHMYSILTQSVHPKCRTHMRMYVRQYISKLYSLALLASSMYIRTYSMYRHIRMCTCTVYTYTKCCVCTYACMYVSQTNLIFVSTNGIHYTIRVLLHCRLDRLGYILST